MKFYFREQKIKYKPEQSYRVAHILKDENDPKGGCLCSSRLNLQNWRLVEALPEGAHLCTACEQIARRKTGVGPAGEQGGKSLSQ